MKKHCWAADWTVPGPYHPINEAKNFIARFNISKDMMHTVAMGFSWGLIYFNPYKRMDADNNFRRSWLGAKNVPYLDKPSKGKLIKGLKEAHCKFPFRESYNVFIFITSPHIVPLEFSSKVCCTREFCWKLLWNVVYLYTNYTKIYRQWSWRDGRDIVIVR